MTIVKAKTKTIYVDIDGTICTTPEGGDYSNAVPLISHVEKINSLYRDGHTIVYWTARGTTTKKDWVPLLARN